MTLSPRKGTQYYLKESLVAQAHGSQAHRAWPQNHSRVALGKLVLEATVVRNAMDLQEEPADHLKESQSGPEVALMLNRVVMDKWPDQEGVTLDRPTMDNCQSLEVTQ